MDDLTKYEDQLKKNREVYANKLIKANAARDFTKTEQGQLALEMISERVTLLMNKAFATTPLTHDEYLSVHGSVRELQTFTQMLNAKEADAATAQAQLKQTDEQLKAVKADGQG